MKADERIALGLSRQLVLRGQRLAAGERPLGWKAGLGAPESLQRFDLSGPLVGFLTDVSVVPSGTNANISDWARPVAEPEIAVYLGNDLEDGVDPAAALAAITAVGPAIELANVDPPPAAIDDILAGNLFHKAVILGQPDPTRAGGDLDNLTAIVQLNGEILAETSDLEGLAGNVGSVVAHLAGLLESDGQRMRAGEVIICGSVIPPVRVEAGDRVEFELVPFPPLSIDFV